MAIKYIYAYSIESIPDTIKMVRKDLGLTQDELAKMTGLSMSIISRYELGTRKPTVVNFQKILEATGHQLQII